MLTRRHIRAKVMQNIYAINKCESDAVGAQEKFMNKSFDDTKELYLLMISTLLELRKMEIKQMELARKRHLATEEEKNPNTKFIDNQILQILENSSVLKTEIEDHCGAFFHLNEHYIKKLLDAIKASDLYREYMMDATSSFKKDQKFIVALFSEWIAPNEDLYDLIEDQKLTWVDDFPVINTIIVKQLSKLTPKDDLLGVPNTFKDEEDHAFGLELFRKTILNYNELIGYFKDKTLKWNIERVADLDVILLCMSIAEMLNFPSIPVKVTINEYIELSKDYSTPKSKTFINGILNVVVKELKEQNKIQKTGRGLIE